MPRTVARDRLYRLRADQVEEILDRKSRAAKRLMDAHGGGTFGWDMPTFRITWPRFARRWNRLISFWRAHAHA